MKLAFISTTWVSRPILLIVWLLLIVCLVLLLVVVIVLFSLFHPTQLPIKKTPASVGLPYENIQFTSKKGQISLSGWLIPAESEPNRLVIFAHGYGDHRANIQATFPVVKALHEQKIASLLFDFRNSGQSGGNMTTVGIHEQYDLLAAIQFAQEKGYQQIGLMGFSMGAATSLVVAAQSEKIQAVVADSAFSDLKPYLEENLPAWSNLPSLFTPLILHFGQWFGLDMGHMRPIEAVQKLQNRPILFIHTSQDTSIPVANSIQLWKAHGEQWKQNLWLTPGADHLDSYESVPQQYVRRVIHFFKRHL